MLNMGGLLRRMPRTGWTFIVGALALTGIFPWAGFWSKDEILADAWNGALHGGEFGVQHGWALAVWLMLTLAAFLTAFYTGRQIFLTFAGKPRTEAATHAPECVGSHDLAADHPGRLCHFPRPASGRPGPTSSSISSARTPSSSASTSPTASSTSSSPPSPPCVAARRLAHRLADLRPQAPHRAGRSHSKAAGPVYTLLKNKYYIDEIYQAAIIRPVIRFAKACFDFDDKLVIDPIVDGVGRFGRWLSETAARRSSTTRSSTAPSTASAA